MHNDKIESFLSDPDLSQDPMVQALAPILLGETGQSSTGYAYLKPAAYLRLRDNVPHILGWGPLVLSAISRIKVRAEAEGLLDKRAQREDFERAESVIRQVTNTAAITAPSDLWLLRHVLGTLRETGLTQRLLDGQVIDVNDTLVADGPEQAKANTMELEADLSFLLSRGYVSQADIGQFRAPTSPRAMEVLKTLSPLPTDLKASFSNTWYLLLQGKSLPPEERKRLIQLGAPPASKPDFGDTWLATLSDIEIGFRLVPLALGLRAAGRIKGLIQLASLRAEDLVPQDAELGILGLKTLEAAGFLHHNQAGYVWSQIGPRALTRGPGPMGIIEAYHKYLEHLKEMMIHGRGNVWVTRSTNIAASQDANRTNFKRANEALDRFCQDTGFELSVFIEHAIGRGEATRQRFQRPGGSTLSYVGADLEDPAIDACLEEQKRGNLPENMHFVRHADIGKPELLTEAIKTAQLEPNGSVMIVGNGFHEVRNQDDENMIAVFRGYCEAGIIMLFTEESALSVDDLLNTAWNTYHAGFKYMHEKSGQGLRPADYAPTPRLGRPLQASWHECASKAGYRRMDQYCFRSRTIYPSKPADGHNPSISVTHFFVPEAWAKNLGL